MTRPLLGTRPLDGLRSRLGLFRGGMTGHFALDDAAGAGPRAGPFEAAYFAHDGAVAHKWHHYLPLYDRYFAPWRERAGLRFLEIGVADGGSLELWRGYFGPGATVFGIDNNPDCAKLDGNEGARVRVGSQADPAFLRRVVEEMGGIDIVVDDGSHVASHVMTSFETLFPLLSDGGLYVVEDLHTAYWKNFEGGFGRSRTFIEQFKRLIDDMHHWYHPRGQSSAAARDHLAGLHMHDSIAFIEKRRTERPVHSFKGTTRLAERT